MRWLPAGKLAKRRGLRWSLAALLLLPSLALALTSDATFDVEIPNQNGSLRLVGQAAPNVLVTFLREGAVVATQLTNSTSDFDQTLTNQGLGTFTYGIFFTDVTNRNSDTISFSATVLPNTTVTMSGFLLPPTFALGLVPIKRPQTQSTFGVGRQDSTVTSFYHGDKYGDDLTTTAGTDLSGNWAVALNQTLHLGNYSAKGLLQASGGAFSPPTQPINFRVLLSADLNNDNRVNLTDFSILMFYYSTNTTRPADINDDGRVNLTDFSILLFYWTG